MGELIPFPITRQERRARLHATAGELSPSKKVLALLITADKLTLGRPGVRRMAIELGVSALLGPEALAVTVVTQLGAAGADALQRKNTKV